MLSEQQEASVKTLALRGLSYRQIGEQLSIGKSVAHRAAVRLAVPSRDSRGPTRKWTDERLDVMQEMIDSSASWNSIGEVFGVSPATAGVVASVHGLTPNRAVKRDLTADEIDRAKEAIGDFSVLRHVVSGP